MYNSVYYRFKFASPELEVINCSPFSSLLSAISETRQLKLHGLGWSLRSDLTFITSNPGHRDCKTSHSYLKIHQTDWLNPLFKFVSIADLLKRG